MSFKLVFLFVLCLNLTFSLRTKSKTKLTTKTTTDTKAIAQTFVVESVIYESQCSSLPVGFAFSLELTTTSKYEGYTNSFSLISTNSSDNGATLSTYCYLKINDDEILCQTVDSPSLDVYGPFKLKALTSALSFECTDSSGNSATCAIAAFEDDSLVGYSLVASILMEQENPQYINYQTTDRGSFQIDYEYFNNYAPVVYLNGKEVNCDVGNNQLTCYVDKTKFSVSRGNTVAYDVTILNDCGIVEDIDLEVDIINKAVTTNYNNDSNQSVRLKVDFLFLFVLFLVLI